MNPITRRQALKTMGYSLGAFGMNSMLPSRAEAAVSEGVRFRKYQSPRGFSFWHPEGMRIAEYGFNSGIARGTLVSSGHQEMFDVRWGRPLVVDSEDYLDHSVRYKIKPRVAELSRGVISTRNGREVPYREFRFEDNCGVLGVLNHPDAMRFFEFFLVQNAPGALSSFERYVRTFEETVFHA